MKNQVTIAAIQIDASADIAANLKMTADHIRAAAHVGASLIATPECTDQILPPGTRRIPDTMTETDHPGIPFFSDLAKDLSVWILIGSMAIRKENGKLANRSILFSPGGNIAARYDKIHLFDVDLPTGESHRESAIYDPGAEAVCAQAGHIRLGMSICYDVRFGHLFRDYGRAGAQVITVPAAFTVPTGQAAWHVLLRAHAIESGAYILAPAQSGTHGGARKTFGHSLIVAPTGEILADAGTEPGFISVPIDLDVCDVVRRSIPALHHDRPYTMRSPGD